MSRADDRLAADIEREYDKANAFPEFGPAYPPPTALAAALRDAGYVHRDEVAGARAAALREYRDALAGNESAVDWIGREAFVEDLDDWIAEEQRDAALAAVTEHLGGEEHSKPKKCVTCGNPCFGYSEFCPPCHSDAFDGGGDIG